MWSLRKGREPGVGVASSGSQHAVDESNGAIIHRTENPMTRSAFFTDVVPDTRGARLTPGPRAASGWGADHMRGMAVSGALAVLTTDVGDGVAR